MSQPTISNLNFSSISTSSSLQTPTYAELKRAVIVLLDGIYRPEEITSTTGIPLEEAERLLTLRDLVLKQPDTHRDILL